MTDRTLRLIVQQEKRGNSLQETEQGLTRLGSAATRVGPMMRTIGVAALGATGAIAGFGLAAGVAWNTLEEGAALELASSRFDKLTDSIGSTADAMLTKLKSATAGMVSDAELIASANEIIGLGLANTEEGVVRLANLIAQLGWDMQTVIMTFANDSKMRLDALGLSVTDVEERMKKFTDAGVSASEAFDLAVIEAGEAKLELLGSAAETSAGQMKILETAIANVKNQLLQTAAVKVAPFLASLTGADTAEWRQFALDTAAAATSLDDLQRAATEAQFAMDFAAASPVGNMDVVVPVIEEVTKAIMEMSIGAYDAKLNIEDMFTGHSLTVALRFWEQNRQAVIYNREEIERLHGALFITPPDRLLTSYELMLRRLREFSRGQEGGLLGNLFARPDAGLDYEAIDAATARLADASDILLGMQETVDAMRTAWRADIGGGFLGMFDADELSDAQQAMLDVAAQRGASIRDIRDLAGGGEDVEKALVDAAIIAQAQKFGESVASGAMTAQEALAALQSFIDGMSFDKLLGMESAFEMKKWLPDTQARIEETRAAWREMEGLPAEMGTTAAEGRDSMIGEGSPLQEVVSFLETTLPSAATDNPITPVVDTGPANAALDDLLAKIENINNTPINPPTGAPPPAGGSSGGGSPDNNTSSLPPFMPPVTNQMFNFMNGWSPAQMFAAAQAAAHGLGSRTR